MHLDRNVEYFALPIGCRNRYVAGECPWTQCIPIFQPVVPVAGLSIENDNRVLNNQMKQNAGFTETS
jgi:hypothetical protein